MKKSHLNKAISVDQDSGFSMKGDTIELKDNILVQMPLSVVLLAWPPQGTWGHLHRWGRCQVQSRPRNMLRLPGINVLQATNYKQQAR